MVLGIAHADRLERAAEIESLDIAGVELGAELLSLPSHRGRQRGTRDEWCDTGVVVYLPGSQERTAGLVPFDDQGVQSGPSRIDRRGVSGWT